MTPKTQAELLAEFQALSTVAEDQFEANLASAITDLQNYFAAQPTAPAAPTAVSVTITFSDSSTQTLPQA